MSSKAASSLSASGINPDTTTYYSWLLPLGPHKQWIPWLNAEWNMNTLGHYEKDSLWIHPYAMAGEDYKKATSKQLKLLIKLLLSAKKVKQTGLS